MLPYALSASVEHGASVFAADIAFGRLGTPYERVIGLPNCVTVDCLIRRAWIEESAYGVRENTGSRGCYSIRSRQMRSL